MKRTLILTVSLSAVASCGGGDSDTVSRREACEQEIEALCRRTGECDPTVVYSDCVSVLEADEDCASEAGHCPASVVDECKEDLAAMSCEATSLPASCGSDACD